MVDSKENYKFELGVKGLIRNYNGYDLLCSVIGLQNSRLPFDQSDVNWNQSLIIHSIYFRGSGHLYGFILCSLKCFFVPSGAPVIPPRQPVVKHPGYENIPEKEPEPLPPRQSTSQGYENLPPKDEEDPPALPPRIPSRAHGYENVPTRDERSPSSKALPYQNIRPGMFWFFFPTQAAVTSYMRKKESNSISVRQVEWRGLRFWEVKNAEFFNFLIWRNPHTLVYEAPECLLRLSAIRVSAYETESITIWALLVCFLVVHIKQKTTTTAKYT